MSEPAEKPPARRSDATRAAILEAARSRFAAEGFRKATIRAVAADAGIDPSMVMRYFGSKDGLFAAAVDVDLRLPDLSSADPESLGGILVRRFLALWEKGDVNRILLILLRSAIADEALSERVRRIFGEQVLPAVLRVGDPADAPRRGGLIVTQLLGLALCRYVLLLPPVVALTTDELIAAIAPTLQRYLMSTPEEKV